MLTEFQTKNFKKNLDTCEVFLLSVKERTDSIRFTIEFMNMMETLRIDIISEIKDEFFNGKPFYLSEKIIWEILQMELSDIEEIFFSEYAIDLNMETKDIWEFYMNKQSIEYPLREYYNLKKLNLKQEYYEKQQREIREWKNS